MGDGRAVLRSVIREYLAGHALNSLGVATSSNAVGFTSSAQGVQRKIGTRCMMYVPRTVIFAWDILSGLISINLIYSRIYPKMHRMALPRVFRSRTTCLAFATQVIQRTAVMIAKWQLVGFAHGVMNTDNLNITGSTLDFTVLMALWNASVPNWINNHSDYQGRYTYQQQPALDIGTYGHG